MRHLLLTVSCLFFVVSASAQRLYFGGLAGTSVTSNFPSTFVATPADAFNPASSFQFLTGPKSIILGLSVEAQLPGAFSLEADVLRRPLNATLVFTQFPAGGGSNTSTNHYTEVVAWEFPVLLKYRLPSWRSAHPFLAAGPAFRAQHNAEATELSQVGISAGAGASFDVGRIRIAPQLRYTRWADRNIYPRYAPKPDQIEFLTGISYGTDAESRRVAGRSLQLGVLAGLPLAAGFASFNGDETGERFRYLAGLSAAIGVGGNLAIEADGIYKPLRGGHDNATRFTVLTWQFPILARYTLAPRAAVWRPFVEAGPSFRLAGNLNGYNPSHDGVTVGAGIEKQVRRARLLPALRYTRWAGDAPRFPAPPGFYHYTYPRTNANALDLIVAIAF